MGKHTNMSTNRSIGFWSATKAKAPLTYDAFALWIDEYKQKIGWNNLFAPQTKFHDLPMEFQIGVISKFLADEVGADVDEGLIEELLSKFVPLFALLELRKYIDAIEAAKR